MFFASITDPVVNFAVDVVDKMGLLGVFLLMVGESACLPIPSEGDDAVRRLQRRRGRVLAVHGDLRRWAANVVGSWIAYAIGYFGRVDLLEKHGRKVFIKPHHLHWADNWFEKHGDATVFFTRMLPIIRTFISLPAGVARMPFWRFTTLTALGCIPWVFMLVFIGKEAGESWVSLEGQPALHRLRGAGGHRDGRHLAAHPLPAQARERIVARRCVVVRLRRCRSSPWG